MDSHKDGAMRRLVVVCSAAINLISANLIYGSEESIGPNGINSITVPLDGAGVAIGQVEGGRPGRFTYDTNQVNSEVVQPVSSHEIEMQA
jgi:hypothetical protein